MRRLILGMALSAAAILAVATPASAHAELISTNPADGSTLSAPPAVVSMTFSEDMLTEGAAIVVKTTDGDSIDIGDVTVDGATVSAEWPASVIDGVYVVSWRAVADDGHPEQGTFGFTVAAASPSPTESPSPTDSPSPTASPTSSPSPTASPSPTTSPTQSASPSPTTTPQPTDGGSVVLPALLGIGIAAAVVGVIALLLRRGRQAP